MDEQSLSPVSYTHLSAAGVNLSVLYAEGKLNVWVNAQKVGSDLYPVDKDGKALFAGNAKVAVVLQTWQYRASFSNLILRGSGLQPGDKGLLGGWSMNLSASGSGRLEGAGLAADGDLYRDVYKRQRGEPLHHAVHLVPAAGRDAGGLSDGDVQRYSKNL